MVTMSDGSHGRCVSIFQTQIDILGYWLSESGQFWPTGLVVGTREPSVTGSVSAAGTCEGEWTHGQDWGAGKSS